MFGSAGSRSCKCRAAQPLGPWAYCQLMFRKLRNAAVKLEKKASGVRESCLTRFSRILVASLKPEGPVGDAEGVTRGRASTTRQVEKELRDLTCGAPAEYQGTFAGKVYLRGALRWFTRCQHHSERFVCCRLRLVLGLLSSGKDAT